jgi:RHH-type transcriptional regulator, rel operon repressor / antitoxin RelB
MTKGAAQMLAVRIPDDLDARLSNIAKKTGRTKSFYVRAALTEKLADLEDYFLAEERMADIRSGKTKTIPLEDLMAEYGLND